MKKNINFEVDKNIFILEPVLSLKQEDHDGPISLTWVPCGKGLK